MLIFSTYNFLVKFQMYFRMHGGVYALPQVHFRRHTHQIQCSNTKKKNLKSHKLSWILKQFKDNFIDKPPTFKDTYF